MYIGIRQACPMLGLGYDTIREYCRAGIIPFIKAGNRYKVNPAEVEKALLAREVVKQEQKKTEAQRKRLLLSRKKETTPFLERLRALRES